MTKEEYMTKEKLDVQEKMESWFRGMETKFQENGENTINETIAPLFVECDAKQKTLTLAFATTPWARNPNGVLHGGFMATAFDNSMGILAHYYGQGRKTQTVSMQVMHLRPGIIGERFMVRASLTKLGKTLQYVTAEAWSEGTEEKLVATATGIYHIHLD